MGAFSIWHWLIVLVVVLVLFGGKGKISALMGDFGKGLKSFKKGMKDEETAAEGDSEETQKALKTDEAKAAGSSAQKEDKAANG